MTCVGWTARFGILYGIESDGPGVEMLGMRQTVAFGILCGIECDGSDMDVLGAGQTVAFGILYGIECDGSGAEARGNERILRRGRARGGRVGCGRGAKGAGHKLGTGQTVAFGILYGIECDGSGVEAWGNKRVLRRGRARGGRVGCGRGAKGVGHKLGTGEV